MSTELHAAWRVFIGLKKTFFDLKNNLFPGSLRTPCSRSAQPEKSLAGPAAACLSAWRACWQTGYLPVCLAGLSAVSLLSLAMQKGFFLDKKMFFFRQMDTLQAVWGS